MGQFGNVATNPANGAPQPSTIGNGARRVIAALRGRDIDAEPLLLAAGLRHVDWEDRAAVVSAAGEARLIELAAEAAEISEFGLRLAESANPRDSGLLYFLLNAAPTVREIARLLTRYMSTVNASIRWKARLLPDGGELLELLYAGLSRKRLDQTTEYHLGVAIRHIRQITGRCVSPTAVSFAHYRMSGRRDLERYFNCPVEFAQPADRLVLSRQALDTPNPSADPRLFDILEPYVERAAKALDVNPESYRDTVESKLYRSLKSGEPKVEAIAPLLAVSPRTLERRLAEEGTSFSEILDHLRRSLALRYLEEAATGPDTGLAAPRL